MNEKLIELLEKIIESEEIQHNLQNQNTLEEAYQYCLSIKEGYTIDEFQDFLREIVRLNGKVVKSELSEKSLEDVTGGLLLNSKKEIKILSALLGSALILPGSGLVNAQERNFNVQAAESSIEISKEVSENKTENIFDNLSEKSKKALSALAEWAEKFVGSILDATSPKVEAMTYPELDDFYGPDSKNLYPKISEDYNWSDSSNLPTASPLVYGQKLSESTLSGGNVAGQGKFVWKNGDKTPSAGTQECDVQFIPNNGGKTQNLKVKVKVQKATPQISSWPTARKIEYGDKLGNSPLEGGKSNVRGYFKWAESEYTPNIGYQQYAVVFKPYDSNNYLETYAYIPVNVTKACPKIYQRPSISSLHYGQNLSDAKFENGRTNVKGTFSWKKDEKNMNVGTYTKKVVFTPQDTKHYEEVEFDVRVTVDKAPVEIYNVPDTSPIVYGNTLSRSAIGKVRSSVPGTIRWSAPYKIPLAGQQMFEAIFIPLDFSHYKSKSIYVPVTVNKATPKLDVRNISVEYTPNLTLENISLPEGWSWEMPNKHLERVGAFDNLNVIYRGDSNYNSAVEKVTVFVDKGNPKLSVKPVNYEKNKTLDSISLPKGWHWNNPKELLLTDKSVYSARYDSKEAECDLYRDQDNVKVNIQVNKSQPKIIAWPHPRKDVVFGDNLENADLVGGESSEEGTFKLQSSIRNLRAGTYLCKVVFEPFDKGYTEMEGEIKVKIVKNNTPMNVPSEINENKVMRADTSINLNIDDKYNDYEYSKDGGKTWQGSSRFVDLTPKTEYEFVYRYKDTDSHCAGKVSKAVKISTKSSAPDAPTDFKFKSKTNHKIVFEDNENLEYSIDEGNTWQDSPVFDNLSGSTEYSFIARVKETDEHVSGVNSEIVKIKTYSWISNLYHKIFG